MTKLEKLPELRKKIDSVDERMLELLNERARLAIEVAKTKTASAGDDICFYRPDREADVLRKIKEHNPGPMDDEKAVWLFREIMSACLAIEKPLSVAFLGPEGTFTQQAAYKHFGHAVKTSSMPAIDEIFREVESGACQYGVVPVENSTEGVITHTLDSFLSSSLLICGEVELRIHHHLLSQRSEVQEIQEVFSHQQSFAQCRRWLDQKLPHAKRTPVSSNAEAARLVKIVPKSAAIAGEVAGQLYSLNVLVRSIEDEPNNTTRFLIIGKQRVGQTQQDKTTILVSTKNQPGGLYKLLAPFSGEGISLTRIESRPSRQGMWDYVFFIDLEGHQDEPQVADALAMLKGDVNLLKVLGSYPQAVL